MRRELMQIIHQDIRVVARSKSSRDRNIFTTLLGDGQDTPRARARLAKKYAVSCERIGQIYRAALEDLRCRLERRGISGCEA